jgi:hypothetical protein
MQEKCPCRATTGTFIAMGLREDAEQQVTREREAIAASHRRVAAEVKAWRDRDDAAPRFPVLVELAKELLDLGFAPVTLLRSPDGNEYPPTDYEPVALGWVYVFKTYSVVVDGYERNEQVATHSWASSLDGRLWRDAFHSERARSLKKHPLLGARDNKFVRRAMLEDSPTSDPATFAYEVMRNVLAHPSEPQPGELWMRDLFSGIRHL